MIRGSRTTIRKLALNVRYLGQRTHKGEVYDGTLVRLTVREFVHEMRHPTPLTVRYLRCDGCGQVTLHSTVR